MIATVVALSAVVPGAVAADATDRPTVETDSDGSADAAPSSATDDQTDNHTAPPDPDEDVIGWENGYWYNESIDVDRSDGLNDSELDAVVARGMARVEVVRQLEFQRTVPVDVISREQYREENAGQFTNVTDAEALHQNVKWEATLMVGEDSSAIAEQEALYGSSVAGYYSPTEERIVIVSENTTAPKMNEITLSQELFHALQDQQFNTSRYNQSTRELHNAKDGIIEGDGNYVDYRYGQRCEAEWDCLMPQGGGAGGGGNIHLGIYLTIFQPYSDGPAFVEGIYEEAGWEGVNAVYENPPASTEQVIHPEKYGEDAPTNVSVATPPSDDWERLEIEGGIDHASFGEAGMFSMLLYPTYDSNGATQIIRTQSFINRGSDGQPDPVDPYNYSHPYTAGWDGDKLVPFVSDDAATNETAYVWNTTWDSEADASEFVEGYRQVLEYRNAESVEAADGVYRIPDDAAFGDAFAVVQDGTTVTIVNAPTLDGLDAVHADAPNVTAADMDDGSDSDDSDSGDSDSDDSGSDSDDSDSDSDSDSDDGDSDSDSASESDDSGSDNSTDSGGQPGFGVGAAVAALLASLLLARRRA